MRKKRASKEQNAEAQSTDTAIEEKQSSETPDVSELSAETSDVKASAAETPDAREPAAETPDVKASAAEKTAAERPIVIEAKQINRIFHVAGGEFQALKDIDLSIPEGTLAILKGRSGSGKTTLLNILGALDKPTSGKVFIDGKNVCRMSARKREKLRRKQMGFVFQAVSLIPTMNAYQNVEFSMRMAGIRRKRAQRVEECLKLVGLGNRMKHMPAEMSGGEQQRVAIARALANSPKLLLADEPTGNLDPNTAEDVFAALLGIIKETGLAALIATHNMELAARMSRQLRLQDGKLQDLNEPIFAKIAKNFY